MASAQTGYQKTLSRNAIRLYDFDPDATSVTEIAWVDMRDFERFMCTFFRTIGTAAVTFKIMANSDSAGGNTDVDIVAHAVGDEPNAVADQIHLECSAEQLGSLSTAATGELRYVTAVVSVATGTDEGAILYLRERARFERDGLTADIVA